MAIRPSRTPPAKIQRDSPDPIYRQIAYQLRDRIVSGKIKAGHPIPAESELMQTLGVSRVTVRQAIDLLVSKGLVVRKQGKGTFVSPPKIQQDLHSLRGLAEVLAVHGSDQIMEVASFAYVEEEEAVARALRVAPAAQVLEIKRRHRIHGIPVAVAHIYLPMEYGSRIQPEEVSSTPIYTLLMRKFHLEVKRGTEVIRATACDQENSALLEIPRGKPLLMVERITYSMEEEAIEYIVFHHPCDVYEITVDLDRNPEIGKDQEGMPLARVSAHFSKSLPWP